MEGYPPGGATGPVHAVLAAVGLLEPGQLAGSGCSGESATSRAAAFSPMTPR